MNSQSPLRFPRTMADRILAYAQNSTGSEVCGLVGCREHRATSWYPVDNIAHEPRRRFQMDPEQQIAAMKTMRERGEKLFAIVHSHPHSPAVPSEADREEIGYPDAFYVIVSLQEQEAPEIRCFRLAEKEMQEIELVFDRSA